MGMWRVCGGSRIVGQVSGDQTVAGSPSRHNCCRDGDARTNAEAVETNLAAPHPTAPGEAGTEPIQRTCALTCGPRATRPLHGRARDSGHGSGASASSGSPSIPQRRRSRRTRVQTVASSGPTSASVRDVTCEDEDGSNEACASLPSDLRNGTRYVVTLGAPDPWSHAKGFAKNDRGGGRPRALMADRNPRSRRSSPRTRRTPGRRGKPQRSRRTRLRTRRGWWDTTPAPAPPRP